MNTTTQPAAELLLMDQCDGDIRISDVSVCGTSLTLSTDSFPVESPEKVRFLVQEIRGEDSICLHSETDASDSYHIDLTPLKALAEYKRQKVYCFFIELTKSGQTHIFSLSEKNPPADSGENWRLFSDSIWMQDETASDAIEYVGMVYTKADFQNHFCAALCSRNRYMELTCSAKLCSLKMSGGILRLIFHLRAANMEYVKTFMTFRSKLAEDAVSYDFTTVSTKKRKDYMKLQVSFPLSSAQWKSLYWDVRIQLQDPVSGNIGQIPIEMNVPARMFHKFLYNGSYAGEGNFFLYPYYTAKRTLAFVYREKNSYDGMDIVFKEFLAVLLYRIAKPYWKSKHICLVCEKFSSMAQDNGYYFFKHCMENQEETYLKKKIYYIITKDSPDRHKVEPYKNRLLDFMSIRHLCYLLAADLIVSSDSRYHTYPLQCRHSIFNRYIKKIPFVFLQHGVIALKRVDNFYGKGQKGGCNMFVVSTNAEKQTIIDNFGYEPEQVINTGLPRWDVLHDKSQGRREIMIMPTWRNWLDSVPDSDFEQSDYFINYMNLLNSRRLGDILEKYDMEVNFYLHAKFQEYSDRFQAKSERIHLISFGEVAVNEMLMRCRMLITDYSSVCWDVLYQDKPILFYQFDLDKYDEAHGSYLDMRTELFGDRAENQEELLDLLEQQIKNDFKMKPEYEAKRKEYFQFKDQQHSRHICEEIKKGLL